MSQLHLSVSDEVAKILAARAEKRGQSLSKYLAELVSQEVQSSWPEGYLDRVLGSCSEDPLEVPEELMLDDVEF